MSTSEQSAQLWYAKDLEIYEKEKPYSVLSQFDDVELPSNNLKFESAEPETITDVRPNIDAFTLDNHGFAFLQAPTTTTQWKDRREVEENYLPEVKDLIKQEVEDVDEVEIFDWRWRDTSCCSRAPNTNMYNPTDPLAPATNVHLDQSPSGALKRIRHLAGEKADYLLRGRVRIVNVWRPLYHVVKDWPLIVCDGSSVTYKDMLEVDLIRRDYIGSTMFAKYRPGYRWYYLAAQQPHEVCLFKNFDSATSVKAQMCPHASFASLNDDVSPSRRQSIEVRAFVYTYPKD